MSLVIAPASHKAASYAATRWHYSRTLPVGRLVIFGAWEDERFIGVVIFSRGSSNHLGVRHGLTQTEVCELTRIALTDHEAPVSQITAECLRRLKRTSSGLRLVISFADPGEGHHGGIYQAGNWVYTGMAAPARFFRLHGRLVHERNLSGSFQTHDAARARSKMPRNVGWLRANVDPAAEEVIMQGKHRYLYPLDRAMRRQVMPLAKPYPAAEASMVTRPASGEERQVQALQAALVSP